jgi:hypothetical protein
MSTEGVTKEVTCALLRRKKIWIVGAEKILGLPSSLFLGMTAPLNLIESNHPLPHDSVLLTQNLHWMLWIGLVGIERHDLSIMTSAGGFRHFFSWDTWNTLCTPAKDGGSSKWYATAPSLAKTRNGPM